MTDREKLTAHLWEAWAYAEEMCGSIACRDCPASPKDAKCMTMLAADHLLANGVVVREKGEWSRTDRYGNFDHYNAHCTKCGYEIGAIGWSWEWKLNFCPNCGADMRRRENG